MRLCRFGNDTLGVVEGEAVRDVTAALDALPAYRYPLPTYDVLIANLDTVVSRVKTILPGSPSVPLSSLTLLSPLANPGKLVAERARDAIRAASRSRRGRRHRCRLPR